MYAVVGICIAEEVYDKSYDENSPIGAIVVTSVHVKLEDAEKELDKQKLLSKKGPISFIYFVTRLGALKVLKINDNKTVETKPEEPIADSKVAPEPSELESLATSFSTLLHSIGVKKHSEDMISQANKSIPVRSEEVKKVLMTDPSKREALRRYYEANIPNDSPIRIKILQHLDDVDENGIPTCVNFSV